MTLQAKVIAALSLLLALGLACAGCTWWGYGMGVDHAKARQADIEAARQQTRDDAQKGAANAIAQVKITNTTVRAAVETRIREVPVYRSAECSNDPGVRDSINRALRGEPTGRGVLPASAASSGG
jgi:hypothetical protein